MISSFWTNFTLRIIGIAVSIFYSVACTHSSDKQKPKINETIKAKRPKNEYQTANPQSSSDLNSKDKVEVKHQKTYTWSKYFVDIKDVAPNINLDIRYYTNYNFIGQKIDGYNSPKCLLTKASALALKKVQKEAIDKGYSLKIYDCYRPQKAVDHFVRWAKDINSIKMKEIFYPNIDKRDLFYLGYIASRSGHSRGSTVDLTLVSIPTTIQEPYTPGKKFKDNSIDMGTEFDFFDPSSHTISSSISTTQQNNRLLLKSLMEKNGFINLPQEWWHYTLNNEPFPNSYFNFSVE